MFAVLGIAGLFGVQQWAHREQVKHKAAAVLQSALKAAARTARLSCSSDRRSASSDSSRSSSQQHGKAIRDGSFVCFKDRTGQVAVIQPYGNGGTWQLAVTCASGGCCLLPEGAGNLAHISGDSVFLVRQVGNNFAFSSPGAEGRYLSAVRDLNTPPVLESTRLTPAAQWKVTGQGISNVMHPHKKLSFSAAEVKLVPLEFITAVERSIADFNKTQQDKVFAAEAVSKALQSQLQEASQQLAATTADYDEQVQQLKSQLCEACMFNTQLTGLIEQKDAKMQLMKDTFTQIKTQLQGNERELSTAYTEVATLQQQLAERDDDVHQLQQRMCNETKQWNQLRAALQDSLAAKDEEITALSLQVQRMEHALRSVEHTLYGMRKPRRLDRASLDAVSIHQLQAAVDNFAAVGDGVMMMSHGDMSTEEAEALRVLLEQQNMAAGGSMGGASAFDLEPGTELSLQDLDRIDQGSPEKHTQAAAAAAAAGAAKAAKSPRRGITATAAASGSGRQAVGGSARRVDWPTGAGSSSGGGGGGLLSTWGLSEDAAAVSSSRGARSSATSEGRHRYAGDASDCDSQDGDAAAGQHAEGDAAAAGDDADMDAAVCTSMDEDELQQQLGRLKASASQLTASSSRSSATATAGRKQQQQVGPLRAKRPSAAVAGRPYASLSQLSPVKEEQLNHYRSKSSAGLSAAASRY